MINNLQKLGIRTDSAEEEPLSDYSCTGLDGQTSIYFRNLERHLIDHIHKADVVLGCVAWLTSEAILAALAELHGVSIIVQKEDFLRPDIASRPNWARRLRALYERLPDDLSRFEIKGTFLESMSTCEYRRLHPVRCIGNYNAEKAPAFPRSHHKFVVFCRWNESNAEYDGWAQVEPYAVWTGSFNFTETANRSFENALVLRDPNIVNAYYQEYAQIAALSEHLDWESEWSAPEWRIGT